MRKLVALLVLLGGTLMAQSYGFTTGVVKLESAEALAFGPDGILFVGDSLGASVVAVDTGDRVAARPGVEDVELARVNEKIAALVGTTPDEIRVRDVKVNPVSKNVYLAVMRGRGVDGAALVVRVGGGRANGDPELRVLDLRNIAHARVQLPGIPARDLERRRASRQFAITDMQFADGKLMIAGLSNEDFSSTLRVVAFPFTHADRGSSIEIFHVAHHNYETEAPVRTMVPYTSGGVQYLLAAYTCTPLVKLRVADLKDGAHVTGETLAELGAHNSPLDMVHYRKAGRDFLLVANTSRGMLKMSLDQLEAYEVVDENGGNSKQIKTERVPWLKGVTQLDAYDDDRAVALFDVAGRLELRTIGLP